VKERRKERKGNRKERGREREEINKRTTGNFSKNKTISYHLTFQFFD
jgi:hypothetical protein